MGLKIGLDYGGVIDNDPDTWADIIRGLIRSEHQVFIISHAHPGQDEEKRESLSRRTGAINLSFSDTMDENVIRKRKAYLVIKHDINLFVDDYFHRCEAVYEVKPTCNFVCIHYSNQGVTQKLIRGLINGA